MTKRLEMRLYERYTLEELTAQMAAIIADKKPQPNSIYLYDKAQRTRMEALAWATRYRLQEAK